MVAIAPLGVLTFANPALLWAAAACAAPLLVHLFLRVRPRRQSFPAMQLLMATKTASVRSHRVRNWLLLLLRMLAIALLVAALARPVSRGSWMAARSRGPTVAAFVIDDSASMSQRYAGQSRLERGRAWAKKLLDDTTRFPAGSSFAMMTTGFDAGPARLVEGPADVLRTLQLMGDGVHDRSLAAAVDRAGTLVASAQSARRELYVVTDNTAAAWADASAGRWNRLQDTAVFILDVGDTGRDNARLVGLRSPGPVVPPRTPIRVACSLQPGERSIQTHVDAYVDGSVVARSDSISVQPGSPKEVSITLPRLASGVHACELRIASPDANSNDDSLFFALEARTPPGVLVIAAGSDAADADEAQRVAALLSPPTLPEDRRPFAVDVRLAARRNTDLIPPANTGSVIWIGEPPLNADQRKAYDRFLRGGGRLLALPAAISTGGASRSDLLPARWTGVVTNDRPTSMRWTTGPRVSGATTAPSRDASGLPFDLAFTRREDVDPLGSRKIIRHAQMAAPAGAVTLAEFTDGAPAILARDVGAGAIVQFAFRLDPQWGDMGVRAATAMVMFHSMVGVVGGASRRVAHLRCGESGELDCGGAKDTPVPIQYERGKAQPLLADKRRLGPTGKITVRADSAGLLRLVDPNSKSNLAAAAVNLGEGETPTDRIAPDAIRAAFAPGAAVVLSDPGSLESPTLAIAGDREWDGYLILLLILLLAAETIFSNRFYRSR